MVGTFKEQLETFYEELPTWGKVAAAGGVALLIYIPYKYYTTRPRKSPIKTDFEKDVVYLYQFPRVKSIPSISPYCLKLETWLRMADIHYENVPCGWNVRSREGTLPFIEYNGREYPDSSFAIRDLTAIHRKESQGVISVESNLDEEQRAISRAFEKLAENSLLWTVAQIRYTENTEELLNQLPSDRFGPLTPLILKLMKGPLKRRITQIVKATGIGKHSRDEVVNMGIDDLRAISGYLGSKHYFTGFRPTRVDATLFGVLAQIVYAPYDLPHKKVIFSELTNLKEYCDRIKEQYWPDWEECTTKFTLNSDWKKKV